MCFQGNGSDFHPNLRRNRRYFLQCPSRTQTPESDETHSPCPSVESETSSVNSCSTLTDYRSEDFSIEDDQDEEMREASSEEPTGQSHPQCEFAGICPMGTEDETTHRKIISHIFGRNKSATKVFPQYVWVHYCRKHYQRARYRAAQWPFTQCDLLLESLSRMEQWGGVQSFQLILRRREQYRVDHSGHVRKPNGNTSSRQPSKRSTGSSTSKEDNRRTPRAVMAPVPKWLRERTGDGLNFNDVREIIHQVRQHMEDVRRNAEDGEDATKNSLLNKHPGTEKKKSYRPSSKRSATRTPKSPILFPDVEIIPIFKQWALDQWENTRRLQERKDPSFDDKKKLDDSADRVSNSTSSPRVDQPMNGRTTRSKSRINNSGGVQKP